MWLLQSTRSETIPIAIFSTTKEQIGFESRGVGAEVSTVSNYRLVTVSEVEVNEKYAIHMQSNPYSSESSAPPQRCRSGALGSRDAPHRTSRRPPRRSSSSAVQCSAVHSNSPVCNCCTLSELLIAMLYPTLQHCTVRVSSIFWCLQAAMLKHSGICICICTSQSTAVSE